LYLDIPPDAVPSPRASAASIASETPGALPAGHACDCRQHGVYIIGLCVAGLRTDLHPAAMDGVDGRGRLHGIGHKRAVDIAGAALIKRHAAHARISTTRSRGGPGAVLRRPRAVF